jgi:hypothetical protein
LSAILESYLDKQSNKIQNNRVITKTKKAIYMKIFSGHKRPFIIASQTGFTHRAFMFILCLVVVAIGSFRVVDNHASAAGASSRISSGIKGYCLDVHKDDVIAGSEIDIWKCNSTIAQSWQVNESNIVHDNKYCLAVSNNATTVNSPVVLDPCSNEPGQVWLSEKMGFYNPNSDMCLTAPTDNSQIQLFISSCSNLSSPQETWNLQDLLGKDLTLNPQCSGAEGEMVACNAEKEWSLWQSGSISHESLLNTYTDGAPYEEWCADFVSYVYKQAGYPFTQGEADGWDESNANLVQNDGFTIHQANSGYIPQPGDVAYFNYLSGHVEIVVAGGKNPTFIYGNSGTIDPTTGNGQMEANTITQKTGEGQLIYYLTPNSGS